jgi:hypothetical protein
MQANVIPGPGVTIILPSGAYTLTRPPAGANGPENGDLNLTTPISGNSFITITGSGAASTSIDANQIDGVLSVEAGRTATISGVTIRNGFRNGKSGGGISNKGLLTITDCIIESNQTDNAGGGIYNVNTLNIRRSTIRSNSAFLGGGVWLNNVTTIRDSSLYANHANYGGGIEVSGLEPASQLTIVNSTISQNSADTNGGGIDSEADTFLYNVSVIDNDADHDRDENGGTGGGIFTNNGERFVVVNTLIAGNTLLDSPIYDDCHGTLEAYGWNLLNVLDGCTFTGNGTAAYGTIASNSFGSLQDNGGPTLTHALLPAGSATDSATDQGCIDETGAPLTTDQRGKPRPADGNNDGFTQCDVGAFELQANMMPVANPQSVNVLSGQAKQIVLTASDAEGDALAYTLTTQPAHGNLSGVAPNLTYTSTSGFTGDDHFTFQVNDGVADSPAAAVTIKVKAISQPPKDKVYLPLTER